MLCALMMDVLSPGARPGAESPPPEVQQLASELCVRCGQVRLPVTSETKETSCLAPHNNS
jgi:hypothetical protein